MCFFFKHTEFSTLPCNKIPFISKISHSRLQSYTNCRSLNQMAKQKLLFTELAQINIIMVSKNLKYIHE